MITNIEVVSYLPLISYNANRNAFRLHVFEVDLGLLPISACSCIAYSRVWPILPIPVLCLRILPIPGLTLMGSPNGDPGARGPFCALSDRWSLPPSPGLDSHFHCPGAPPTSPYTSTSVSEGNMHIADAHFLYIWPLSKHLDHSLRICNALPIASKPAPMH